MTHPAKVKWIGQVRRSLAPILIPLLVAAACSPQIDLFNSGPAPRLFNLTPQGSGSANVESVGWALFIEDPTSSGALDSDRIAVRPSANEMKYFADARWIDRAPRMFRSLLVRSFEDSGRLEAVTAEVTGVPYDYSLKAELRDFQAEVFDQAEIPTVSVRIHVKIIRRAPIGLVAATDIERRERAAGGDIEAVIAAFDRAADLALRDIVNWTFEAIAASP